MGGTLQTGFVTERAIDKALRKQFVNIIFPVFVQNIKETGNAFRKVFLFDFHML